MKHDVTLIAARIIGPLCILAGVALITQSGRMIAAVSGFFGDSALLVFTAFVTLAMGLTLVVLHPRWNGITAALISLIGWLVVLRGAVLLLAPNLARETMGLLFANPTLVPIAGCVMALIGVWLAYTGFIAGTFRVETGGELGDPRRS